ncbi:uncharacterized oxidoreductase YjmC [Folsomia candida]|uniref:Malate/(S)-sulfolactate dehydrogenase n=1 Tax=Folsomia candida TaxID=158441 RepID=A0A226EUC6_FOLCA|nr:uncharacterized oxidoreductase YjmC [Folsomia candida]OXA61225.1 Malate/(S)-sulfolactate dehydrogenase [Folsomia candida]
MKHFGISLLRRGLFLGQPASIRKVQSNVFRIVLSNPTTLCSRGYSSTSHEKGTLVPLPEVKRFILDCMASVGTAKKHAEELADVLIAADYRGHYSHGLNRLEMYVNDIKKGMCDGNAEPSILKQTAATAFVEGNNGLGPTIGNFCMQLAITKAKESGVGWVVAKGSNHYGIAGWYTLQAVQQKLIGLSFTNTSPFLTPTRSKVPALGTNPLSVAAGGCGEDKFVLDMATTAVAVGKVEIQRRKNEPIPSGWALDKEGQITTDANEAMGACSMMPLGGGELNSGYKGYGLAVVVELFCGIMAGAAYGPKVRKWMSASVAANLGQCFVAIDPSCFAPNFAERVSDLIHILRTLEPVDPNKPVLVAGDPERMHMKKVDAFGGVQYHINQINASRKLAEELKLEPMKALA